MRKLLSLSALGLASCSSADLRPEEWRSAGPPAAARQAGEELLGKMRVAHGFSASAQASPQVVRTVQVEDQWQSTLLRWFTPLDSNTQSFSASLSLAPAAAEIWLGERRLTWSLDSSASSVDGWDAVYADSVHRYFYFAGLSFSEPTAMPTAELLGERYARIWVSYAEDEAVLWLNLTDHRLRWAEFTFRSASTSYRGVLDFAAWSDDLPSSQLSGRSLPTMVVIRDGFEDEAVHTLRFRLEPAELRSD